MSVTPKPGMTPNAPQKDVEGNNVDVVEKDIEQPNPATKDVDKVLTPTTIKTKEQEADEINQRSAEAERLLNK